MQMKNYLLKFSTISIIVFCLFCISSCCCDPLNPDQLTPYDDDGVLKKEHFSSFYSSEKPGRICMYMESSGSMNGLFRPKHGTRFQYDISAILTCGELTNIITGVNIFNNNGDGVQQYDPSEFRRKMNKGDFVSQQSTFIPAMINTMLKDFDACACDVAVLISDMKYSPVRSDGTVTQTDIQQYELDIKNLFESRFTETDMSVSLICCESEFLDKNGRVLCSEFPYYLVLVGKASNVAWVRNQIIEVLNDKNNLMGCIDFNVNYGCPKYTILSNEVIGAIRNSNELTSYLSGQHCSSIVGFDDSFQPVKVVFGANYNHLPQTLVTSLQFDDFSICSHWGHNLDAKIVNIDYGQNHKSSNECSYVAPNIYLTVELTGLSMYEDDVIEVKLDSKSQDIEWLNKYYGATREGELGKTYLLESFINGLKLAKPLYDIQNSSMYMFVSKNNN